MSGFLTFFDTFDHDTGHSEDVNNRKREVRGMLVYPNPSNGIFNVSCDVYYTANVKMTNPFGVARPLHWAQRTFWIWGGYAGGLAIVFCAVSKDIAAFVTNFFQKRCIFLLPS